MWKIVIIMLMPLNNGPNSVEVTHQNNRLLSFYTEEACYNHVAKNIDLLRAFADKHYPDVPIKSINCFQKHLSI